MKIKNNYSVFGLFQLAICLLKTKILFKKSRLIRFPIDIRGKRYIDFGKNLTTGKYCRLEAFASLGGGRNDIKLEFGENVQINDFVHISAIEKVKIGNNVLIASHVYISDNSHGHYEGLPHDSMPSTPPIQREYKVSPVSIGDNAWIGEGVIIMPGCVIGKGTIIGAHSVVNKNIPENCIAVGAPARVIKRYNFSSGYWEKIM